MKFQKYKFGKIFHKSIHYLNLHDQNERTSKKILSKQKPFLHNNPKFSFYLILKNILTIISMQQFEN